jgi:hypothetical protein
MEDLHRISHDEGEQDVAELLPVNISEATVVARASAVTGVSATLPAVPAVADLASWSQENYQLSVKAAAHLGFPIATSSDDVRRDLLIFGTSRWTDVDSGDGHVYRFGISLRVLVQVQSVEAELDLTLPAVAASVQLGRAQASAQLIVRGYNSSTLGKLLPPWQSFTVDSYSQYMAAISAIQQEIMNNDGSIVPQLLATTVAAPTLPSSAQSVGTVLALRGISDGHRLAALLGSELAEPAEVQDSITQTYSDFGLGPGDDPGTQAQEKARRDLGPLAQARHWWTSG